VEVLREEWVQRNAQDPYYSQRVFVMRFADGSKAPVLAQDMRALYTHPLCEENYLYKEVISAWRKKYPAPPELPSSEIVPRLSLQSPKSRCRNSSASASPAPAARSANKKASKSSETPQRRDQSEEDDKTSHAQVEKSPRLEDNQSMSKKRARSAAPAETKAAKKVNSEKNATPVETSADNGGTRKSERSRRAPRLYEPDFDN
jgi:hypothetical protein